MKDEYKLKAGEYLKGKTFDLIEELFELMNKGYPAESVLLAFRSVYLHVFEKSKNHMKEQTLKTLVKFSDDFLIPEIDELYDTTFKGKEIDLGDSNHE